MGDVPPVSERLTEGSDDDRSGRFNLACRPCILNGKRHMVWPDNEMVGVRRYRWWSPLDWLRDVADWIDTRRHF